MMLVGIVAIAPLSSATAESKLTFEADIQPLLNEKDPVFHLPGATLPLSGPLPPLSEG